MLAYHPVLNRREADLLHLIHHFFVKSHFPLNCLYARTESLLLRYISQLILVYNSSFFLNFQSLSNTNKKLNNWKHHESVVWK